MHKLPVFSRRREIIYYVLHVFGAVIGIVGLKVIMDLTLIYGIVVCRP